MQNDDLQNAEVQLEMDMFFPWWNFNNVRNIIIINILSGNLKLW